MNRWHSCLATPADRSAVGVSIIVFLLVVLILTLLTLIPTPGWQGGSTVARWILGPNWYKSSLGGQPQLEAVYTRESGGMRCTRPVEESWDAATRALAERPHETLLIQYTPFDEARGFWAVTHTERRHIIEMSYGSALSESERAEARADFFDRVIRPLSDLEPEMFKRLRAGDFQESRIVWAGYAKNLLSLSLLAALIWLLCWTPVQIRACAHGLRRSHRIARDLCPACGYAMAGLPARTCPECGEARAESAGAPRVAADADV